MELLPRSRNWLQRRTQNLAKDLRWSFLQTSSQKLKAVHYLCKKPDYKCLTRLCAMFAGCAVKHKLIPLKYFKTYIIYIYIILSSVESSFWTPYTCLAFQQKHIQNPFKHLRWSVFACPVNDFKPLTVCAKTLYLRCLKMF